MSRLDAAIRFRLERCRFFGLEAQLRSTKTLPPAGVMCSESVFVSMFFSTECMRHRHLNHQRYTLASIDDLIARGRWDDWAALREAVLVDPIPMFDKIKRVCQP